MHKCTEFGEPEPVVLSLVDLTTHFEPFFETFPEVYSIFIEFDRVLSSCIVYYRVLSSLSRLRGSEPCFIEVSEVPCGSEPCFLEVSEVPVLTRSAHDPQRARSLHENICIDVCVCVCVCV